MVNTWEVTPVELWARGIQAFLAAGVVVLALRSSGASVAQHMPSAILLLVVAVLAFIYALKLWRGLGAELRDSPILLDRVYAALLVVTGTYFTYKMWDNFGCKHQENLKFKCGHVNNVAVIFVSIWILITAVAFLATSLPRFQEYAAASAPPEAQPLINADGTPVRLEEASVV